MISRGTRTGKAAPLAVARLLLPTPTGQMAALPPTSWRAVVVGPAGDVAPEAALSVIKPSAMTPKAEKQLLTALSDDTPARLAELQQVAGEHQQAAALLHALRAASTAPHLATQSLEIALADSRDPSEGKFLRKYLPTLLVCAGVAPGVQVLLPPGRESMGLLLADMLTVQGRLVDAVSVLQQQALTPLVGLALAAAYLAMGQYDAVVQLTEGLDNLDDLTALCLVARGVALRTSGRPADSIGAFDLALSSKHRDPGVVAAALSERAQALHENGDPLAARADEERLQELQFGTTPTIQDPDAPAAPAASGSATADQPVPDAESSLQAARSRVRRRLRGTGAPGTFGGRHHQTYRDEVADMLAANLIDPAENLLLGLIDAVEDESDEYGNEIDPTYYLTLADIYGAQGDREAEYAVLERFEQLNARLGGDVPEVRERRQSLSVALGVLPPGPGGPAAPVERPTMPTTISAPRVAPTPPAAAPAAPVAPPFESAPAAHAAPAAPAPAPSAPSVAPWSPVGPAPAPEAPSAPTSPAHAPEAPVHTSPAPVSPAVPVRPVAPAGPGGPASAPEALPTMPSPARTPDPAPVVEPLPASGPELLPVGPEALPVGPEALPAAPEPLPVAAEAVPAAPAAAAAPAPAVAEPAPTPVSRPAPPPSMRRIASLGAEPEVEPVRAASAGAPARSAPAVGEGQSPAGEPELAPRSRTSRIAAAASRPTPASGRGQRPVPTATLERLRSVVSTELPSARAAAADVSASSPATTEGLPLRRRDVEDAERADASA